MQKLKTQDKNLMRRQFVPFFEKLFKIRRKIGELVINQAKIQVLLVGLIINRIVIKNMLNEYRHIWFDKLENSTLGKLIFMFKLFKNLSSENEGSLIKELEKFNTIRNKIMHNINFYEGPIAIELGKRKVQFNALKKQIEEANKSAEFIINKLENLLSYEIQKIFENKNKKDQN